MDVLDHGYINFIESWGSDERIIEAARMSTSKGFQGWNKECPTCSGDGCRIDPEIDPNDHGKCKTCLGSGHVEGDSRLLSYLWKNQHHTPFEMAGLVVEVQVPIFVAREWHRHRTQSYNELSGRYTELPNLYYIPSLERLTAGKQGSKNKQGSEEGFSLAAAAALQGTLIYATAEARRTYEELLGVGLARELARMVIPVNQYTRFRASANLRNWLHFLGLRLDEHAQWEIRQYASALSQIIQEKFPRTYALWEESFNEGRN